MIPILGQDFATLLGKLGGWPGDIQSDTAHALFESARSALSGGVAVDIKPNCGKSTVVLSAAAFQTGSKVMAVDDWQGMQETRPTEFLWFGRAVKLFKLQAVLSAVDRVTNPGDVQFALCRGDENEARFLYTEGLSPGGVLFSLNVEKLDGVEPESKGRNWTTWRKPAAAVESETKAIALPPPVIETKADGA